ncbi:MAG: indole-3-glycerol phosphate synthase TrpC [Deltaproteobacteria bacterium]|nr:indole-3-glycerol phosphate synthase TrpC [Deltaproteobacteria bacterium]
MSKVKTDILREITAHKRRELEDIFSDKGRDALLESIKGEVKGADPVRDFAAALRRGGTNIIAEVKKASPSKGIFREDFDPVKIAETYATNGAAAISVLTDSRYFMGSLDNLVHIREHIDLPLLRKDFIIDAYQIYEARVAGADAILLIAAVLDDAELCEFLELATSLGMASLVEVHSEAELTRALEAGAEIIGINNRDLTTFETNIDTTRRLSALIPEGKVIVSESGIGGRADIDSLKGASVDAFLIGEAIITAPDMAVKLREFIG